MVTIKIPEAVHEKLRILTARERKRFLYETIDGALDRSLAALDAAETAARERRKVRAQKVGVTGMPCADCVKGKEETCDEEK